MTDETAVAADVDPVIDRLEEIRRETGYDLHRVFRDWMALAVFAFEGNDEEYHDRLDRYARDPHDEETRAEVAQLFSEALGELAAATVEAQRPVVGDVYEQTNNQNEDEGQFFTPWNVCTAKAEMLISAEDADDATQSDPLRVADPACGSARLLVATAMKLHEIDPDASILVSGTDKDRTCARMAVVNLALGNIPGRIRFGNSLTQEIHEVWHVVPDQLGKPVRRLDDDEIGGVSDDDDDGDDDPDHEQQTLITDGGKTRSGLGDALEQIRCFCGETEIRHSHGNLWTCDECGRFHDGETLDLLAEKTRAGIGGESA